jgi:hypothetical protein
MRHSPAKQPTGPLIPLIFFPLKWKSLHVALGVYSRFLNSRRSVAMNHTAPFLIISTSRAF